MQTRISISLNQIVEQADRIDQDHQNTDLNFQKEVDLFLLEAQDHSEVKIKEDQGLTQIMIDIQK